MPKGPHIGSASECPCKFNCETYTVMSKYIIVVFSSYMTLLTLSYGGRMEKTWEAHCRAEWEGFSFREAKQVVEMELYLDKYPCWNMGSPHQSVILHEMFLHATSWGRKEVECMCHWGHPGSMREPSSEVDQSTLHLVGYHTSQREMRDVYHSMYLLNRSPGFPSCGEATRRRAIQEILSSLQDRLQRQTSLAEARDTLESKRELAPQTYEVALWIACQKVVETTTALQSDLGRLDNELRGRPWVHSQSDSWHRMQLGSQWKTQLWSRCRAPSGDWCRAQSRSRHWACTPDWVGAQTQNRHQADPQGKQALSPDHIREPVKRRVSFWMPGDEDSVIERREPSNKPPIKDLESWLEYQVDQLGTPTWWGELKAVLDMADLCKFAQKVQASFHIPEIWSRASPNQGYSAPPAPRSLNQGAFLLKRLEYQDVWQRPILLTKAYCWCLQHWVEKSYQPASPEACPLAESVRELCLAVGEFVITTKQDVLEGLEMLRPRDSCQLPSMTLFSQVLDPPTKGWKTPLVAIEIPQQSGMLRPWGSACPFFPPALAQQPTHPPAVPAVPTLPSTRALAAVWPITLPWWDQGASTDMAAVEGMMPRVSSMSTSRVVWDNSTGSVYLETIMTSIGRMVLGSMESSEGPTIEDITDQS